MSEDLIQNNIVEAYKQVIDYNKVILSLASTILAGQLGYLVYRGDSFEITDYSSATVLVITLVLSLLGFGKSIRAIKRGHSEIKGILFTNLSAYSLIIGILLIGVIKNDKVESLDAMLENISNSTLSLERGLTPDNCKKIKLKNNQYQLEYLTNNVGTEVIYSKITNQIISVNLNEEDHP